MRCTGVLVLALSMAGLAGCGDTSSGGAAAAERPAAKNDPTQIVATFLEAVRLGNDAEAAELLTTVARQKTAELDMVVAPPGSDTASYKVGQQQLVEDDLARVDSEWTDVDHQGESRTDRITWILKQEEAGWRIAGMAAEIFSDQGPIELNFEDPADMLEKQKAAEEEALRRANAQAEQAQNPFQNSRR